MKSKSDPNKNNKLYTSYPKFIKMTNLYTMNQYFPSGALEISHRESDFKMTYMGYGRRDAVRKFKKDLEEYLKRLGRSFTNV